MRVLVLLSLLGFGYAHAGARTTCRVNKVDASGQVATQYECSKNTFDASWLHDPAGWSSGRRIEARVVYLPPTTSGVTTADGSGAIGDEGSAKIVVELAHGKGHTPILEYLPGLGVEEIDEIRTSPERKQIAIVFEPQLALRDHPGQKLRRVVIFDVTARFP